MRCRFLFIMSLSLFFNCKQNHLKTELDYRRTSYEFLRLISKNKIDEAKNMLTEIPDQVVSVDGQLGLIKQFLDENGTVPGYESYVLDSTEIAMGKWRAYEVKLFKDNNKDEYIGHIRIEFSEGSPEKISTFMVIGRPVKF